MMSTMIIGLGNPLMGDEGIGAWIAEALGRDPRLPAETAVIQGGTDLLRLSEKMEGFERIIVLDAMLDPAHPGRVEVYEDDFSALKEEQTGAHRLSAVQAIGLLRRSYPALKKARFTLVLVGVPEAKMRPSLTPVLQIKLREITAQVLGLVTEEVFE